jgi:hypothetical protein
VLQMSTAMEQAGAAAIASEAEGAGAAGRLVVGSSMGNKTGDEGQRRRRAPGA